MSSPEQFVKSWPLHSQAVAYLSPSFPVSKPIGRSPLSNPFPSFPIDPLPMLVPAGPRWHHLAPSGACRLHVLACSGNWASVALVACQGGYQDVPSALQEMSVPVVQRQPFRQPVAAPAERRNGYVRPMRSTSHATNPARRLPSKPDVELAMLGVQPRVKIASVQYAGRIILTLMANPLSCSGGGAEGLASDASAALHGHSTPRPLRRKPCLAFVAGTPASVPAE